MEDQPEVKRKKNDSKCEQEEHREVHKKSPHHEGGETLNC